MRFRRPRLALAALLAFLASAVWMPAALMPAQAQTSQAQASSPLSFHITPTPSPSLTFHPLGGIPGPPGPAGPAGPAGPPGISATGLVGVVSNAPPAGLTAPKGDGVTDDTVALNALIIYCRDHYLPLYIYPGIYRITAPLDLAVPLPPSANEGPGPGFILKGLANRTIYGGVTIRMTAPNQEAVLRIGKGLPYGSLIQDLTLDCGPKSLGTQCAIKDRATFWSDMELDRVDDTGDPQYYCYVSNVDGGGNGEYKTFHNCRAGAWGAIYKNDTASGQAVCHNFYDCAFGTDNGGTLFDIGPGANQVTVVGLSSTQTNGPLTNTLVIDRSYASFSLLGGRLEHVGTLVNLPSGSNAILGQTNITGLYCEGGQAGQPLISGGGTNSQSNVHITSCTFSSTTEGPLTQTNPQSGCNDRIIFDDDVFSGWTDLTQFTGVNPGDDPHIVLNYCRSVTAESPFVTEMVHK